VRARFSTSVQTGPVNHPASCTMGTESFPGVKRPGCGVDHTPPTSAKVKNAWSYTSTPTYALTVWYFIIIRQHLRPTYQLLSDRVVVSNFTGNVHHVNDNDNDDDINNNIICRLDSPSFPILQRPSKVWFCWFWRCFLEA
jgi:hypothetical protein